VVPEITRKLYDLTVAGRIDEARELQYKLRKVFDLLLYSADFPEGVRAALAVRGFRTGMGRQPLSDRHKEVLQKLQKTLWELLAEEGFPCESPGSCGPAARALFDPGQVGRIVDDVVAALKAQGVV